MMEVRQLSVTVQGIRLLHDLSFSVLSGQWVMIVGPNGAGKTTLLRALSGILPYQGSMTLNNQEISSYSPGQLGRIMAMVEQSLHLPFPYTVEQVVAMGRFPHHRSVFHGANEVDQREIVYAMEMTDILSLRERSVLSLSGGERQRVFLAQAICQAPSILLLDEPANHLDIEQQQRLYSLLQQWIQQEDRTLITVVHDLSAALRYGTNFLVMKDGVLYYSGGAREMIQGQYLDQAWEMDVKQWVQSLYEAWKIHG